MLATVKAFGWSNVAVVYTTDDYGTGGFRDIRQGAPNADICISTVVSFGRTEDNGTFQPRHLKPLYRLSRPNICADGYLIIDDRIFMIRLSYID